ncbi:hypothetical protein CSC2_44810 [Clostridium zeae]|uniref:TcaA protein NTF2-like domain-containing protein n=1 Tax=Clostridium zeae TaxID=2759022 RepID=A0ABQ1EGL4_9CLOT|nr:hypothetical protein [Clostridium zeae]GFZ33955.1 hypothetical protein CSC2_44810 [Clostridium zeae]
MKKIILIIIAIVIVVASVIGFRQMNASKVREEEAKKEQINKEAGVRPKQAEIDDLIRNYRNIYVNLVNDKELDLSFLDNVLDKSSPYYKSVIEDITNKRKSNIKLQTENIEVGDLQVTTSGYKVNVKETLQVNNDKVDKISGDYIIKTDNNKIQISDYIKN